MKLQPRLFYFLFVLFLLSGCASPIIAEEPTVSPSPIPPTITPQPTTTQTPIPSPTPFGADNGEFLYTNWVSESDSVSSLLLFSSERGQTTFTSQLEDKLKTDVLNHYIGISPNGRQIEIRLCKGTDSVFCDREGYLADAGLNIITDIKTNVSSATTNKIEDLGYFRIASWSPDSTHVILKEARKWPSGGYRIFARYVMDENGKDVTQLTMIDPIRDTDPFWSYDSKQLYWQKGGQARKLNVVNADGSNERIIPLDYLDWNFKLLGLEFSKDGTKAAVIGHVGHDYFMYITDGSLTYPVIAEKTLSYQIKLPDLSGLTFTNFKFHVVWSLDNDYLYVGAYYNTPPFEGDYMNYKINTGTGDIEKIDFKVCGVTPNNQQITYIKDGDLFIASLFEFDKGLSLVSGQQLHFPFSCPTWLMRQ